MKRTLRWICLCMSLLCTYWSFSPAYTATTSNRTHAVAPVVYTIQWTDESGHIIKTWRGNQADAEKIEQHERFIRERFLQQQLQRQGTKVSPLINRVDPCSLPNDFLDFFNEGLVCFANDGEQSVGIYSVYEVDSGNNTAQFNWGFFCAGDYGGALCQFGTVSMNHFTSVFPPNGSLWFIWRINISGR